MMQELSDLTDLLEKAEQRRRPGYGTPEPPDEEEVARCIQALLQRQCIYPHQRRYKRIHEILSTTEYQGFFRKYFSAMGMEFHYDHRSYMVALRVPKGEKRRFDYQSARLNKEQTLVLLALKLAYEEGFRSSAMGPRGDVEVTTDDLVDRIDEVTGKTIEEKSLREALDLFRSKGVCETGDVDPVERVQPVTILPGIEVAWPEYYSDLLSNWAEAEKMAALASGDKAASADEEEGDPGADSDGLDEEGETGRPDQEDEDMEDHPAAREMRNRGEEADV